MLAKVIALTCFAAVFAGGFALAQTDGPAELPRADFAGQSYVDSQGCVFLKAGYGDAAQWVARVDRDHKPVCGQTPTNAAAKVSDAAAGPAPAVPKAHTKRRVQAVVPAVAAAAAGPLYVQIGAFALPSNADGASARLKAMGLPVSKASVSKRGKALQVIYAGPFASGAAAQMALNAAIGDGFSDAFIR